MGQLAKLEQDTQKMGDKTGLLELKAPQAGIVKDVATTSKGAVVQPGMVLLTLVSRGEQLLAEVQIKNEDMGLVQTGQQVRVKVAAYAERDGLWKPIKNDFKAALDAGVSVKMNMKYSPSGPHKAAYALYPY